MDALDEWLENYRGQSIIRDAYQEGAKQERKRIVGIIDSESYYAISARVKERIEKDSN